MGNSLYIYTTQFKQICQYSYCMLLALVVRQLNSAVAIFAWQNKMSSEEATNDQINEAHAEKYLHSDFTNANKN